MTVLVAIVCLVLIAIVLQAIELMKFRITGYEVCSALVTQPLRLAVLSDLHGKVFGHDNQALYEAIRSIEPDAILLTGDMITAKKTKQYNAVYRFLVSLTEIAPVYYELGNHEQRVMEEESKYYEAFSKYLEQIQNSEITVLDNEYAKINDEVEVIGLTVPNECFEKHMDYDLEDSFFDEKFPEFEEEGFTIMMAHSPKFMETYLKWPPDLVLSGHNHGGLVRIPGGPSIISPEFKFFPQYDGGHYQKDDKNIIVSKGLGTHTFHIRIFNRAELLAVSIVPEKH
ncbi:MAG: metallophosphoesterase [Eubacterium sp.]|nr:metallophosphoesterase [Eubacterium sp.]